MYESFFGLNGKPFSLLPDPSFLYFSKIHKEALTLLEYGLHNQAGFTVLTGEVGSGKTTLMRYLLEELDESLAIGLISHTHKSIGQIMDWICVAFDLEAPMGDRVQQHLALERFLLDQYRQGKKALLIIDEAQNLGLDTLEEIRLLSNINVNQDVFLQLLLLGQPQLREQLRNPGLEQFVQRISASYHLGRLSAEEVFYYIRHRIQVAGGHKEIFTPDACHAIFHYSRGIPRIINLICETALVFSYGSGTKTITGKAIEELVRNDASHLLLAVDIDERDPLPEYIHMFVEESKQSSHKQDSVIQPENSGEPPAAEWAAESPDAEQVSLAPSSPHSVPTAEQTPKSASNNAFSVDSEAHTSAPKHPNRSKTTIEPRSIDELDDKDATILAELIEPDSSTRRWTGEAIAISVGVLLGVVLVGWYLYQQNGNVPLQVTTDEIQSPPNTLSTAEESLLPSDSAPVSEMAQAADVDILDPDESIAARQNSVTTHQDQSEEMPDIALNESVALRPSTDATTPTERMLAQQNKQSAEPVTALPVTDFAQTDDDDQQETIVIAALESELETQTEVETETTLVRNLNEIESALIAGSLPVTRSGPNAITADFSDIIRFEGGSVELNSRSKVKLDQFAELLQDADTIEMKVLAHTDTQGSRGYNMRLSEQRAEKVANYLRSLGIAEDRIIYEGKGEEELKIDAEREKVLGPWINRRIEIELIESN